jgi:hypothetical protein
MDFIPEPTLLPQHGNDFFIENPGELAQSVWLQV